MTKLEKSKAYGDSVELANKALLAPGANINDYKAGVANAATNLITPVGAGAPIGVEAEAMIGILRPYTAPVEQAFIEFNGPKGTAVLADLGKAMTNARIGPLQDYAEFVGAEEIADGRPNGWEFTPADVRDKQAQTLVEKVMSA